ncbi:TetR/AcrR family transcriptional regulator [Microbispora bryophytorum]|uniref:TetR/AcrR family transcriptional regulator n=1 Tax=Microbispora bryophytorum subsp. camponoti TaxID=1677852 RepID=A0ABR8L8D1_9ACTN|nr:TetR/AcrR family transcriptional regulator [Microbispora camponoti]MBD3145922.1 TetR/AcrR family transcriptional regulator [Microbispora camponoti]
MTPSPVRRRLPPAERREEILKAATELIAASGFKGVTLEAFAAACGMTKAGLLHHFRSREDLLIAVLERRDTLDLASVADTLEPAPDAAVARAVMSGFVRRNLAQRSLVQLYTVLSAEALDPAHPAHAYFRTRLSEGRAMLESYLLAWHPRPGQAAVDLLAFLDGLQLNWLRDAGIDFLAQWEAFADRFFAT